MITSVAMRVLVAGLGLLLVGGCTKKNPALCCLTAEQCDEYGFDEITGCALDHVCHDGQCITPECSPSVPCSSPTETCEGGVCVPIPDGSPQVPYIAFMSDRDGNAEIYRMEPDGTRQTNLSNDPGADEMPRWNSSGTMLAFTSDRSGVRELYVMSPDGADTLPVSGGVVGTSYAWSPDGRYLAFVSDRSGTALLYLVRDDGSDLVPVPQSEGAVEMSWSPDSSRLVFTSPSGIVITDLAGTSPLPIGTGNNSAPVWHPSANTVAHEHRITFQNRDVYTINADGSNEVNVTNTSLVSEASVQWSPDGTWLLLVALPDGEPPANIAVVRADGQGGVSNLTTSPDANEDSPCWNGSEQVFFTGDEDGNSEIYVVPRSGGNPVNLTNSVGTDSYCSVRPAT
jgi:Tol biopolymer transport system component